MADASIINIFSRKPVPDMPDHQMAEALKDQLTEFREIAQADPDTVSADDQEWFCSMFRDLYLSDLLEAVRGIEEADMITDLEDFVMKAMKVVAAWPKVSRA